MKKMLMVLMVGILTATMSFAAKPTEGQKVTYAQLAELLVKALGLADDLPAGATPQQMFDALMLNGISPAEGWTLDSEAEVSTGDLARVLVQALGGQDNVENPSDPKSWVDALKAMGYSLDSPSETMASVSNAEVLPESVVHPLKTTSTDPLLAEIDDGSRPLSNAELINGEVYPVKKPEPEPEPQPTPRKKKIIDILNGDTPDKKPVNPTPH